MADQAKTFTTPWGSIQQEIHCRSLQAKEIIDIPF
jgi:hypothetical protein